MGEASLQGIQGEQPGSFCPAPIVPESRAAKATASGCPVGSVFLSLAPRIRLVPYHPPWQTQVRLRPPRPDLWKQASKPLPPLAGLPQDCRKRLLAWAAYRLPDCPIFLAVRPYGGVHSPLGQFPRLGNMSAIRLGIGCERKTLILVVGIARKPLLLFRHRRRVHPEKVQAHRERCGTRNYPVFAPASRG